MNSYDLFSKNSTAVIYNNQPKAIQRMLDFDAVVGRKIPSVSCIVNSSRASLSKFFFGDKEILIPMYKSLKEALNKHPDVEVFINFSSFRSAYASSKEAILHPNLKTIIIIAEGIPERQSRELASLATGQHKWVIGPATVGGVKAGAFRVGNSAGTIENIISSKLHRPGSVGLVTKSGGLSNELYNIISRKTDGTYEGIAVGGDLYPGSTLFDHVTRMNENPEIKMIVVLGEVGGVEEYKLSEALSAGKIQKPIVAWVTGTCAKVFPAEVQFGHAGAKSGVDIESAYAKNMALSEAGAHVPASFDDFGDLIGRTFDSLNIDKNDNNFSPNLIPEEYIELKKAHKVRKSTNIISSISNDKGEEATYNGIPISTFVEENKGIGSVIGHLWFKKELPKYITSFIEMGLIITADHGPAVSGAHNAIVASRAGKDVVSSLASGLLTIGPRFGGALNGAAQHFKEAMDKKYSPREFVSSMKKRGINIPGIGHRIKSSKNPDKRVELIKNFVFNNFEKTDTFQFALEVEKVTTSKKDNLILNVDGALAVAFLDIFSSDHFTQEEARMYVEMGSLNALFVLGRSIGLIGHIFDQKRLKQPLYRHELNDILYLSD